MSVLEISSSEEAIKLEDKYGAININLENGTYTEIDDSDLSVVKSED